MITITCDELNKLTTAGTGRCATVYMLTKDRILKMYDKGARNSLSFVEKEFEISMACCKMGIPTAKPFDMYECEGVYGASYEYVSGDTMFELIKKGDCLDAQIKELARIGHDIHLKKADRGIFPKAASLFDKMLPYMEGWLSKEEYAHVNELICAIPDRDNFIHGDFHPDNVITGDRGPILIDAGGAGAGHPVFDFFSMYRLMKKAETSGDNNGIYTKIYEKYLEYYFGGLELCEHRAALTGILDVFYYISMVPSITAVFSERSACDLKIAAYVDRMVDALMSTSQEDFKKLFDAADDLFAL